MTRGRKPDPAAIKRAKGNPGRRPIHEPEDLPIDETENGEEQPAATLPDGAMPPAWLDTSELNTPEAKEISAWAVQIWRELYPNLVQLKLLKSTDANAFGRYCRYMAEWIKYTRQIDREGATYTSSSEHVTELKRPHPAVRFRKDVEQHLKDLGESMGLTPASRQRIMMALAGAQGRLPFGGESKPPPDQPDEKKKPDFADDSGGPIGLLN